MARPLISLLVLVPSFSFAATNYLQQKPALSATHIVFSYAGDLWSVPRAGGDARRLTTGVGVETDPVFSPDGSLLAFTGEYDGNSDVYVMPAAGGIPKRLTYHPGSDEAVGWTPDGKRVLFSSGRTRANDGPSLFTIPVEGGFPDELPLPIADEGSYSRDGSHLAYVPVFQWQAAWKRYRGGQTRKIWIANLADSSVVPIPRDNSNDFNPMWAGDRIYFLSDRNGPVTLFSYDTRSGQVQQLIENRGLDFKSASAGPGAIVYEQFGSLGLYEFESGQIKALEVRIAGDLRETRPYFISVGKRLRSPDISPNGARAVFEARGEIVTVPADKGDPRNLSNSPGTNEREPVWSPDGKTIAYFSDESGEYALHLRDQSGMGKVTEIGLGKPAFYLSPCWSPDSHKIAYLDNHLNIWYVDIEQKKPVLVDTDSYPSGRDLTPAWSSDSKWLAYAKTLRNRMTAIHLYSLAGGKTTQVTDGMSEARYPVFDKDGKYLYFAASTDAGPSMDIDVGSFFRPVSRSIYLVVLAKNQASPLAPESDEEKIAAETKSVEKPDVRIDFDSIGQRILALPMPARRYEGLQVGKAGVLYAIEAAGQLPDAASKLTIHRHDLGKRKTDIAVDNVRSFRVAFNGGKMLYQQEDRWVIADTGSDTTRQTLKTDNIEVRVDPRAEWKQMYHEAWRIERDFFYDPNYHGLDLKAAEKRYEPYLENIAPRRDLNYLFTEMMGELSVSHLFVGGGDWPEVKNVPAGLLGADYRIENGRYRFARVYNGENWNPDLKAPLTQPGVNVSQGEYLLAVNGRELRGADNIYSFFEGAAGKAVVLKVGPDVSGANAREVTVTPVGDEKGLRHLAWIEGNRRTVEQMTDGRVAYIHMPDTAHGGYASFNRYFFAQLGREAAIIDDRFNHGGHFATDIIAYLQRPVMLGATLRDGVDWSLPLGIYGPKAMIINEFAGSGGDAMPWMFQRFRVGKLIGKRTWGGLIGNSSDVPELMDGGAVKAPGVGFWNPNGQWDVENNGVQPDIEVEMDPKAVRQGHDPQLEKAVQVVMEELEKNPLPRLQHPPYPTYHR
jgi:tricorn protease